MKEVNGVFLPDGTIDGWLKKCTLDVFGFPLYQRDRVVALDLAAKHKRRFVDGGAHVGLMTVPMVDAGWLKVEAFEPHPANFDCLNANVSARAIRGCVSMHPAALGKHPGKDHLEPRKVGSSLSYHLETDVKNPSEHAVPVNVVTIDSFGWKDVDAIKLDLEGGEYLALQGAVETIKRCKPVIMIEEKHDTAFTASFFLRELGMTCTWSKKNDRLFTWAS